eukprot:3749779-Rhodomonas_salina.1
MCYEMRGTEGGCGGVRRSTRRSRGSYGVSTRLGLRDAAVRDTAYTHSDVQYWLGVCAMGGG